MTNPKKIEFLQWINPFLPADEQANKFTEEPEWAFAKRRFGDEVAVPSKYSGYYLVSKFTGALPLNDSNLPEKRHKLWEVITSFDLSKSEVDKLKVIPGVEGFNILSRYRFWLMVGHLFRDKDVHEAIRASLCPPQPAAAKEKLTDPLQEAAASLHEVWAIVKNGKVRDIVGGDSQQEVEAIVGNREILTSSWKH